MCLHYPEAVLKLALEFKNRLSWNNPARQQSDAPNHSLAGDLDAEPSLVDHANSRYEQIFEPPVNANLRPMTRDRKSGTNHSCG